MSGATESQQAKLLEEVRHVLRLHHYSIHTERSYVEWIGRFLRFHGMRSRTDLCPAEPKIEAFPVSNSHYEDCLSEGTEEDYWGPLTSARNPDEQSVSLHQFSPRGADRDGHVS